MCVDFKWLNQFTCHSFPCKPSKEHYCLCILLRLSLRCQPRFLTLFPSVFFSCSSTWRSVTWVCHEEKLTTKYPPFSFKEGCPTSDHSRWREQILNFISSVCYPGISFWGQGRAKAGNIYAQGESRVVFKVKDYSQNKDQNDEDIQSRKWITACLRMSSH